MCQDSRNDHSATRPSRTQRRHAVPSPRTETTTATARNISPHATSTTTTRPCARETATVTAMTTATASRAQSPSVITSERPHRVEARHAAGGTVEQHLVDPHPAVAEGEHPTHEVEPPHAQDLLADERADLLLVRVEGVQPGRDR